MSDAERKGFELNIEVSDDFKERSRDLNERCREVLLGIIEGYLATANPVGSKFISESRKLNLSPASIRNIMAVLEDEGYIYQPHFSAGRVPTAMGYRFYISSLMKTEKITQRQKETVKRRFDSANRTISGILSQASVSLSALSHYAGVVLAPDTAGAFLLHVEFIRVRMAFILVVIVFKNGITENKSFSIGRDIKQSELHRYSEKVNNIIKEKDCDLDGLREILAEEMRDDRENFFSALTEAVLREADAAEEYDNCLYVGPEAGLLDEPEFSNNEQIKFLIKTISDKKTIIKLLALTKNCKTKQIFIGSNSEWSEITGLSLITAPYFSENNKMVRGSIGIIGPSRMNYSQVIPIIDFMAQFLGEII